MSLKSISLSQQLLTSILGIYVIITLVVTLVHVVIEYNYTKSNIQSELNRIAHIFEPALQTAMWNLSQDQVESIAKGMREMPLVYGVNIVDANNNTLFHSVQEGMDQDTQSTLMYSFSLFQTMDSSKIYLAKVTLYSSERAIFERLKVGFAMLFLNAMIKSVALILLFYIAFRKHLERPLYELMQQISNLKENQNGIQTIDVDFQKVNEFTMLQSKFNELLHYIHFQEDLRSKTAEEQNRKLEHLVKERTNELEIANQKLQRLASTDALTQIANRSKIDEELTQAMHQNKRYNRNFSVVMIDIDHFKNVNDTYGHQVGDSVLKTIASLIKKRVRAVDVVGRWGGEEFMILYHEADLQTAAELAENIRKTVDLHHFETINHITISLGVAQYKPNSSIEDVVQEADTALYRSKEEGRNRVSVFEES